MENNDTQRHNELLATIKKSLTETIGMVDEMGDGLMDCASLLRVEQSERSFAALSEGMKNLSQLVEFIKELRTGLGQLKGFDVPAEVFSCWDRSVDLFRGMLTASEGRDWITLSDLIEYELNPLLTEGKKGLSELNIIMAVPSHGQ